MENVHRYDGSLSFEPVWTFDEADEPALVATLRRGCGEEAARAIDAIIRGGRLESAGGGEAGNIDTRNGIDARLLLLHVARAVQIVEPDMEYVHEQLADVTRLGPCAQGRTTRLLQVWETLREEATKTEDGGLLH